MQLHQADAEGFVPDGSALAEALSRTTHLGIAAHPDDLEIMALHGIAACRHRHDQHFTGVVLCDGSGGPRAGSQVHDDRDTMRATRAAEQKKAARLGGYSAVVLLAYPSAVVREPAERGPSLDLDLLLEGLRPEVVYTHNLADKHDTHVATAWRAIEALRRLPSGARPQHVYGCEVWRDLDWLVDASQVRLDLSGTDELAAALLGVFASQLAAKRYDVALPARWRAHASLQEPMAPDAASSLALAMELKPLVDDPGLSPSAFLNEHLADLRRDLDERLHRVGAL
jgi:LmbE family N-acetylglucosaminyl deacetylase